MILRRARIYLSIRCILGDIRLWVGDPSSRRVERIFDIFLPCVPPPHRLLYHDAGPFLVYIYYDPPTDIRVRVEVYVHVVYVRIKEAGDDQGARGVDFHSFRRLREGIMAPSPGTNFVPNIGTRP